MINLNKIFYRAELEIADWNAKDSIISLFLEKIGATRDKQNYTICNSSGVGNDPSLSTCIYGGKINTPLTYTIESQIKAIGDIFSVLDKYSINYSSNLYLHIHIPGLNKSIEKLKQYAEWIYRNQEDFYTRVSTVKIEEDNSSTYLEKDSAINWIYNKRYRFYQTKLTEKVYNKMMKATTPLEFYTAHALISKTGQPLFNITKKHGINLMQLFNETDTIEFRCFASTDDLDAIKYSFKIIDQVIEAIESNNPFNIYLINAEQLPKFQPMILRLDRIFKLTGLSFVSKQKRIKNLKMLIENKIISQSDIGINL